MALFAISLAWPLVCVAFWIPTGLLRRRVARSFEPLAQSHTLLSRLMRGAA